MSNRRKKINDQISFSCCHHEKMGGSTGFFYDKEINGGKDYETCVVPPRLFFSFLYSVFLCINSLCE